MELRLKSFLPRGLYGRAALILVVPIVTIQLLVSIVFLQRHFEGVTAQMTQGVVLELRHILSLIDPAASDPLAPAQGAAQALGLELSAVADAPEADEDPRAFWDLSGRVVIERLRAGLEGVLWVDLLGERRGVRLAVDHPGAGPVLIALDRRRVSASNPHQLLVLMVFASLVLTLISYVFLRNQLRPITRLADAAEAFGKGRVLPYRPRGALEVRAAGAAFLDMRARIERQIEQRTLLLSGVSHDLRTPLTRMKLALAMLDDSEDTRELARDVAEMERMLDGFLAFARGDALEEPQPVDLRALIAGLAERAARSGQQVTLLPGDPTAAAPLRRDAVARAVDNLIGNAGRYATRCEISVHEVGRSLRVIVEDDGPGIPRDRREEALRPFTRLDQARDPNRGGGVGLGLAIAADVARSHGGALRLGDSTRLGGLRAELVLAR